MSGDSDLSRGDNPGYEDELLKYLEDRDPLEVMEATANILDAGTTNLIISTLRTPEAEGKWSIIEVVQHMADVELVMGVRYRQILAEEEPAIQAFDQDLWAQNLHYENANLTDALHQFNAMRRANVALIKAQPDEAMGRVGVHSQRGKSTLRDMVRLYAAHDCFHLHQIDRIRTAVEAM